jgi:hypothetical protein
MTARLSGIDTITTAGSNTILTANGSAIEEISQANFAAGLNLQRTSGTNITPASTTGTGEVDLHTLTIPANTLAALNNLITWTGSFVSTGGVVAGTNTLRLYINGVNISSLPMASLTNSITVTGKFQLNILWATTNTLAYIADFGGARAVGTSYANFDTNTASVTTSSPFDIKITGQCAQSDGVTTCKYSFLT